MINYCPHGYGECEQGCVYPGRCGRFSEDSVNSYSNAAIKHDRLHANDGRADQDLSTDGCPLRPGS